MAENSGSGTLLSQAVVRFDGFLKSNGRVLTLSDAEVINDFEIIVDAAARMSQVDDAITASSLARDGWEMIEAAFRGT